VSTALVLGAGASLANALYFRPRRQPELRPPLDSTFFQTVRALRLPLTPALRSYFANVLQVDPDGETLAVGPEQVGSADRGLVAEG
jgi:hypothetical protein